MQITGEEAFAVEFKHSEVMLAVGELHGSSVLLHTDKGNEAKSAQVPIFCSRGRVVDGSSLPCSRKWLIASISQVGASKQCPRLPEQRRIRNELEPL